MIEAGGLTFGGLVLVTGWAAIAMINRLADGLAADAARFFVIGCDAACATAAHDHAADDDAHGPVHGVAVDAETIGRASGKSRRLTGGQADG